MTAPALLATTELVAVAWLGGVEGLSDSMVGTSLPSDVGEWAETGYIVVTPAGGDGGLDVPLRTPVVTCHAWAVTPDSAKPPTRWAAQLAERIVRATLPLDREGLRAIGRPLTLPDGYPGARVLSAQTFGPRPAYGDAGGYAHFVVDLQLNWVELG
jgi:hypothetical protein